MIKLKLLPFYLLVYKASCNYKSGNGFHKLKTHKSLNDVNAADVRRSVLAELTVMR